MNQHTRVTKIAAAIVIAGAFYGVRCTTGLA